MNKEYLMEKYNLLEDEIDIVVYEYPQKGMRTLPISGVAIEILPWKIQVSCHSEKTQIRNRIRCVELLDLIGEWEY